MQLGVSVDSMGGIEPVNELEKQAPAMFHFDIGQVPPARWFRPA